MRDRFLRVGFCVSGAGRLARSAIAQSQNLGISPVLLAAEEKAEKDLNAFCAIHGVPFVRLNYENRALADRALDQLCREADLGLLFLTFDKLIPDSLVNHYSGRIINLHMGLLPSFKGMHAVSQALAADARFVGATIHEVDCEMDHGPIVAQCIHGVRENDSEESLGSRLFYSVRLMYLQVIAWYAAGRVYKDETGRIRVMGARYGELPICPQVENTFADL